MLSDHAAAPPRNPMNARRFMNCPIGAEETSNRISILKAGLWVLPCNAIRVSSD
jgi:hypothetical protein